MILFFYVLRDFFKYVIGTVILCVFLFILFDFIHKTTSYFGRYNSEPYLIFQYYLYQLPFQVLQVLPIGSLLGSVVSMLLLNRNQEIAAMRAAGMSPVRIGAPLLCGGIILGLLSLALSEFVVPGTAKKKNYITRVLIEGEEDINLSEKAHWSRKGREIFNFRSFDRDTYTIHGIRWVFLGVNRPLAKHVVHAKRAVYLLENHLWRLEDLTIMDLDDRGNLERSTKRKQITAPLPLEPKKLLVDLRQPDELPMIDLAEAIRRGNETGANVLEYSVAWHTKCAYPLAAVLISLLGLSFGYRSLRTSETVRSILLALGLGLSYWFVLSATRALALSGDLHPFLGGWTANFVLTGIVAFQFLGLRHV